MSLGKTWWHGPVRKRQDSYGPEEEIVRARFDEAAWEATQAWERKRGTLKREADALLDGRWDRRLREKIVSEDGEDGEEQWWDENDVALIVAIVIAMGE